MLVLSRGHDEVVRIIVPPSDEPQTIDVRVVSSVRKIRLGFTADPVVSINRLEIQQKIDGVPATLKQQ